MRELIELLKQIQGRNRQSYYAIIKRAVKYYAKLQVELSHE